MDEYVILELLRSDGSEITFNIRIQAVRISFLPIIRILPFSQKTPASVVTRTRITRKKAKARLARPLPQ